jgi:hypothetical protein
MMKRLRYECSSNYLEHREEMLDLHRRGYGTVRPDLYDSFYSGNPNGDPALGLCFDGQKLVGQENYIRQPLGNNGRVLSSAVGINTVVDPQYRLFYGVFKELIRLTMNKMKEDTDILCTNANEESQPYYTKYFDWKITSKVQVHKKSIRYSGFSRESFLALLKPGRMKREFSLREVNKFDPETLTRIIDHHLEKASYGYFFKTAEFINWKYLQNKHYALRGFLIEDKGIIRGFVVTCDADTELKVIDFLVENDDIEVFEKTLSALAYIGSRNGKRRLVIEATPECWYLKALKKQFFFRRWDFDFLAVSLNGTPIPDQWVLQAGDFDIF